MRIQKQTIRGSPYLGVFSTVTEKIALIPRELYSKEEKYFKEILGVESIRVSVASSPLLGTLCKGVGEKFLVPPIAEDKEIKELENAGLKILQLDYTTAIGNLVAVSEKGLMVSDSVPKKEFEQIEKFFGMKGKHLRFEKTDLIGSSLIPTQKGFLANPMVAKTELAEIEKTFQVSGDLCTANYGDKFIANSLVANSNGCLAGVLTSGPELAKIYQGLGGD